MLITMRLFGTTGKGSSRLEDQYLIDPNEVRALDAGECFLLRQQRAAKLKVSPVAEISFTPDAELHLPKGQPQTDSPTATPPEQDAKPVDKLSSWWQSE